MINEDESNKIIGRRLLSKDDFLKIYNLKYQFGHNYTNLLK